MLDGGCLPAECVVLLRGCSLASVVLDVRTWEVDDVLADARRLLTAGARTMHLRVRVPQGVGLLGQLFHRLRSQVLPRVGGQAMLCPLRRDLRVLDVLAWSGGGAA
jgi:hypothetical protein